MSVKITENSYINLREHEPSYQAMIRNGDTSNTYDITQRFIKNKEINDFEDNFKNWDWNFNKGLLSDGTYINKSNFFITSKSVVVNEKRTLVVDNVKYFKFKMNCVLEKKNSLQVKNTYISKENNENIYELAWKLDEDGKTVYYYDTSSNNVDDNGKISITNQYSSYPLQRMDKLSNYEMGSLFLYLNGIKIPDNEIFVYATNTFTDLFIPLSYIGDLNDNDFETDITFNVDIRQAGSEDFYFIAKEFSGKEIIIDMSKADYLYDRWKSNEVTTDKTVVFNNGKLIRVNSVEYVDEEHKKVKFTFEKSITGQIELYVLNNIIYRYKYDSSKTMVNKNNTKLHFFLDENKFDQDFVNGPITKNAVSFYNDGKRIDDNLITQTSRYSFEFDIKTTQIDESKIDFFVEDIDYRVDDKDYILYGDDYYLLNMLGVARCVNRMKGGNSYSIFDDPNYQISFKDVLSNNGTLFDVSKAKEYYNNLEKEYKTDSDRCKQLIKKNQSLLREMMQQFATPAKRFIVKGNANDVKISSVKKLESEDALIYYKIYCNHYLIDSVHYTTERNGDYDIITVDKSVLKPGTNLFEVFQYDLTYYNQSIFRDNINNGFEPVYNGTSIIGYTKTYNKSDLPFGEEFLLDDISAIEEIRRDWFTKYDDEYYIVYPSEENKGFRTVKSFEIENVDADKVKITISLHMATQTKGYFYLLYKNYNIVNSFVYHNTDNSYMSDNDLIFPIYSSYVEYGYREDGTQYVKDVVDYIPYINNSEPMVTRNGKELIIGEDYLYITPEKSKSVATSYIILKTQTDENDSIVVQFNSAKTNILVLGYNSLNIDNKYGLIYLSELKYPVDPNYMNIFVNGEKVSKYDISILSDKLIRVYNIHRPINTLLITTNLDYKESELSEYIDLYKPSEFELLLEKIFTNCDPCKIIDTSKPNVDYVYTVEEDNPAYNINHGFDITVDDVFKKENPLNGSETEEDTKDILQVMYINWLNKSGKTRSDNYPELNINPKVLKYFSIFENTVVGNRLDIFMDSGRTYNGVPEDICGEPIKMTKDMKKLLLYPGANIDIKRKFFYDNIFVPTINDSEDIQASIRDDTIIDPVFEALKKNKKSNILYAEDFPLEPDKNGIMWTGSNKTILCFPDPEL